MHEHDARGILEHVVAGELSIDDALRGLRRAFYEDLGHSRVDHDRAARVGYPEVIYCAGKTNDQIVEIVTCMLAREVTVLGTRATPEMAAAVLAACPDAEYDPLARTIVIRRRQCEPVDSYIAVVTAGTSDLPVAEEARVTAELYGNPVRQVNDAGVAGIHRLFADLDVVRGARVVIVVAGMEGALASVVAGQVDRPVIAVPTSVGYGANFGGLSALLGMLNSCAGGISVVNIDNGFGAAYLASIINHL